MLIIIICISRQEVILDFLAKDHRLLTMSYTLGSKYIFSHAAWGSSGWYDFGNLWLIHLSSYQTSKETIYKDLSSIWTC